MAALVAAAGLILLPAGQALMAAGVGPLTAAGRGVAAPQAAAAACTESRRGADNLAGWLAGWHNFILFLLT
jgi:hypothetical protein